MPDSVRMSPAGPQEGAGDERHGVIFDVDGLMKQTEEPWRDATHAAFAERGLEIARETLLEMHGRSIGSVEELMLNSLRLQGKEVDIDAVRERVHRAEQIIVERFRTEPPADLDGLSELLDFLTAHEHLLARAIGSSAEGWWVDLVLGEELRGRFAVIVSWDDVRRGKPDPAIFIKAAEKMGIPPQRCIVLGDARADVEAALCAGMQVIQVPGPEESQTRSADRRHLIMPSLSAVTAFLKETFAASDGIRKARG